MGEVYFKLDIVSHSDFMAGQLVKFDFAQASLSQFTANAQRVIRRKPLANDNNTECYCIVLPTMGRFAYRQRKREGVADRGSLYILSAQEPYEVDISDGSEMVCLTIPCDLLRARVCGIDDMCGRERFADPVLISTLHHLLSNVLDVAPRIEAIKLQDLVVNIIDMMTERSVQERNKDRVYSRIVVGALTDKVRLVMRANIGKPEFGVANAAIACGVSVRQLQQAMQIEKTTFGKELLEERLLAASRLLRSHDPRLKQIGTVASICGFASQSHFANRYRERFGHSPRDERSRI